MGLAPEETANCCRRGNNVEGGCVKGGLPKVHSPSCWCSPAAPSPPPPDLGPAALCLVLPRGQSCRPAQECQRRWSLLLVLAGDLAFALSGACWAGRGSGERTERWGAAGLELEPRLTPARQRPCPVTRTDPSSLWDESFFSLKRAFTVLRR